MDPVVQEVLKTQYRLQLVRRIGRGNFGEVWEATTAEGVPCALKISLDPLDWGNPGIERELENLELIKNLAGHPHVVSLQNFWQIHGYLVTRWELAEDSLEGILRQYRQQGKEGIPLELLLQFVADAAQGIDFLNSRGIVHRDIKPSNLLVFFGRVKVGDLGLAKLVGASTGSHTGAGTLGYLPPEAYGLGPDEKGRLSPTVDLYGLAASYVKLRTGQEPFGEHPAEIVERQKAGRPLVDKLTPAEKVVVLRALSPRPEERPKNGASAWVSTLREAVLKNHVPAAWMPRHTHQQPSSSSTATPPSGTTFLGKKLVRQVSVDPRGKGDVKTLAEAIEQVEENGIIRLAAGTHYLENPLELTRPVRLIGEGMDRTEVVCDGPNYVLKYSGSGRFVASGITFKHTGKAPAHVVVIAGGEVLLESCRFSGGVLDSQANEGGSGLVICGSSKGYVKGCQAVHNEANGIAVADQAQPTLEGNKSQENGWSGIAYWGSASGLATKNTCRRNKVHGIHLGDQAQPTLEANACEENDWCGIAYYRAASGVARRNTCCRNTQHGVYLTEQARPTLEGNTCRENEWCGIAYGGSASGVARDNTCSRNKKHGVYVEREAQPTLQGNTCKENEWSGIAYLGSAAGIARNNTSSGNRQNGIVVAKQARPTLEANTCQGNEGSGIAYFGSASGLAVKNTCSGNRQAGIFVSGRACPSLSQNRCLNNLGWGIFWRGAFFRGAVLQNTVVGNQAGGTSYWGCSTVLLVGLALGFGGKLVWNAIWEAVIRFWS